MLLVAGLDAQLNMASEAPIAKRRTVRRRRGLKTPELKMDLIRIGVDPFLSWDWTGTKVYSEWCRRVGCLHFCNQRLLPKSRAHDRDCDSAPPGRKLNGASRKGHARLKDESRGS